MLWNIFHIMSVFSAITRAWTNIIFLIRWTRGEGSKVLFAANAMQENKLNIYWRSTCNNIKNLLTVARTNSFMGWNHCKIKSVKRLKNYLRHSVRMSAEVCPEVSPKSDTSQDEENIFSFYHQKEEIHSFPTIF